MAQREKTHLEDWRQLEHLLPVGFAFLLPYLSYAWIVALASLAVLYALYVSPRWIQVTTRGGEVARGFSAGKLYYALGILVLVLLFPEHLELVASVWGILAVGDSVSNWVGRRLPLRPLPFNPKKSLGGSLAFWFAGSAAAWVLLLWNLPAGDRAGALSFLLPATITASLCALAEALPDVINDNVAILWVGAMSHFLLLQAAPATAGAWPWRTALAINLAALLAVRLLDWISWRGAALAGLAGAFVYASFGPAAYSLALLFVALASLATRAGYAAKARLGLAEGSGGRRGISNVLAKGAVPLLAALFHFHLDGLLEVAYAGALAGATFDTVATEMGQWLGRTTWDPVRWHRVARGTPGAVSLEGTAAGLLGAAAVAALAWVTGWLSLGGSCCALAGALWGNTLESVLSSWSRPRMAYAHEALNLYGTLFGAFSAALAWGVLL